LKNEKAPSWGFFTLALHGRSTSRSLDYYRSYPAHLDCQENNRPLVERMLALHQKLGEAKEEHARTLTEREIAALDARIDRLVYELYGLTEEEIGIVEG